MSDGVSNILARMATQGDLFEVHEVRTFGGYLKDSNEQVAIEIVDMGDKNPGYRFAASAHVLDDPARKAAGNPGPTIEDAIKDVHWNDLKRR